MSISQLVRDFNNTYFDKINLIASENLTSPNVRMALQSDFSHRYAMPAEKDPVVWDYPDQDAIREIRNRTEQLACKLFEGKKADVSPLSGNQVALIMLTSLLKPGDRFLSVPASHGGHFATEKIARERGYERLDIPYSHASMDVELTSKIVQKTNAKLIFLDASMILFPYPVRELREAIGNDVIISYDGSHTMGIIAGRQFQSPLSEGADFFHGSTHKSLWGPQKGLIVSAHDPDDYEPARSVFSRVMPLFVSNAHPHHIAALGIALEEADEYGKVYAQDVIVNARSFGTALQNRGLKPLFADRAITNCHQVILPLGSKGYTDDAFRRLEAAHINANAISIPYTNEEQYGLRFGLSEITRRGMDRKTVQEVAGIVADVVRNSRPNPDMKRDVQRISLAHQEVFYTP